MDGDGMDETVLEKDEQIQGGEGGKNGKGQRVVAIERKALNAPCCQRSRALDFSLIASSPTPKARVIFLLGDSDRL